MIAFNADEYRERLNSALGIRDTSSIGLRGATRAAPEVENPYDVEEAPQQQPQKEQPKQGGMNLGAIAQGVMGGMGGGEGGGGGMPGLDGMMGGMGGGGSGQGQGGIGSAGGMPDIGGMMGGSSGSGGIPGLDGMISEGGAMGGANQKQQAGAGFSMPMTDDGKIATRPPDLEAEADPEKMGKAKTIDDVFEAAPEKTQGAYMDWWEKSYGDINQKYDRMKSELGEYKKLPDRPSKKQMFVLLLGYGARMMSNMLDGQRGGRPDPMAASDDAFGFAQDTVMGNKYSEGEHKEGLAAIEEARAKELKGLGTRGEAMTADSEINLRDAQAENYRAGKADGRIVDDKGYVFTQGKDNKLEPLMRPDGKGQLRQRLPENLGGADKSEFERQKASYIEAHGYDEKGNKLTGKAWTKVLREANDFARYGSREKGDADPRTALRTAARSRVDTIARSSPDLFRGMEPDEVTAKLGEMEDAEYNRLLRSDLGSSPLQDGPRAAAPKRSEDFVRKNPNALGDFVEDYGYVPEGMEQHVTPEIRERLQR